MQELQAELFKQLAGLERCDDQWNTLVERLLSRTEQLEKEVASCHSRLSRRLFLEKRFGETLMEGANSKSTKSSLARPATAAASVEQPTSNNRARPSTAAHRQNSVRNDHNSVAADSPYQSILHPALQRIIETSPTRSPAAIIRSSDSAAFTSQPSGTSYDSRMLLSADSTVESGSPTQKRRISAVSLSVLPGSSMNVRRSSNMSLGERRRSSVASEVASTAHSHRPTRFPYEGEVIDSLSTMMHRLLYSLQHGEGTTLLSLTYCSTDARRSASQEATSLGLSDLAATIFGPETPVLIYLKDIQGLHPIGGAAWKSDLLKWKSVNGKKARRKRLLGLPNAEPERLSFVEDCPEGLLQFIKKSAAPTEFTLKSAASSKQTKANVDLYYRQGGSALTFFQTQGQAFGIAPTAEAKSPDQKESGIYDSTPASSMLHQVNLRPSTAPVRVSAPVTPTRQPPLTAEKAGQSSSLEQQWACIDVYPWLICPSGYAMASVHPIHQGPVPRNWVLEGACGGPLPDAAGNSMSERGSMQLDSGGLENSTTSISDPASPHSGDVPRLNASAIDETLIWTVLSEHINDTTIDGSTDFGYWRIPEERRIPCSRFRIRITGPNVHGTSVLQISQLEFFGRLLCSDRDTFLGEAKASYFAMADAPQSTSTTGIEITPQLTSSQGTKAIREPPCRTGFRIPTSLPVEPVSKKGKKKGK